MNTYSKLWRNTAFMQLILTLFLVEFVRGAMLISFMAKFAANELLLSVQFIGIAISAHYVADTMAKTVIGYWLDRISVRIIVPFGLFLSLISFLLLLNSFHHPWLFVAAAGLYGLGVSPIWIVSLSRITEEDRISQTGVLYGVWLIGLAAGPFLINLYIDSNIYLAFWMLFTILGLSWICSFFIPDQSLSNINQSSLMSQLNSLWRRMKAMKFLLPGMILQSVGASMLVPVLPIYIEHQLGLSAAVYSFLLFMGGGCAIAGLLTLARWEAFIGKKQTLALGFVGFSAALFLLTQKPPLGIIVITTMVLGFSFSAVLPAWNALLARFISPAQAATGWGAFSTIEGFGVMIGPILGGMLAFYYNLTFPIVCSACLFAGMGCFYYFWYPEHTQG